MKKILTILSLIFVINANAQDSTKIQVSIQSRDAKYISAISSKDLNEEFFDAVKFKYRVLPVNIPTGVTLVQIDSIYTIDWIAIYTNLKNNPTALNAGCTGRVETILRAVNQSYLNNRLDAINASILVSFVTMQEVGLFKFRRQ